MKKTFFFIILSLLAYMEITNAQCPFSITFSSQVEIDSFIMTYPGCTSVPGAIAISGGDITNLDSLINLTFVGGYLRIYDNDMLANIDGLLNITSSIGGDLRIYDNALLTNIDGLANTTSIEGDLQVYNNALLANIDGLANITSSIEGDLRIYDNALLTNIDGLANITSVEAKVSIKDNAVLSNIDGLANITSVGDDLSIYNNALLANIDGLANLISIGADFDIYDNALLANIDGLANLTSIGGYLYLSFNPVLSNIDGLANLTSVGDDLEIYDNDMLALCCGVFPILDSGGVSGDIIIESNLPNCDSEEEILDLGDCAMVAAAGFALSAQIYLQGAYDAETGNMKTLANPYLPLTQPYSNEPYNYTGTESVTEMPTNVVDWVLVEARAGTPSLVEKATTVIETKAGLLLNTGEIVGVDGTTDLRFDNLIGGENYHICIRQRNHVDVFSASPISAQNNMSYDFTSSKEQAFGAFQQILLSNDKAALFVGDYNQDNVIQVSDSDAWKADPAQIGVYSPLDGTLDGTVQVTDLDAWAPNKAKIGTSEIGF